MFDWLNEMIGEDSITVYEGQDFTEDAVVWLREKPRTFRELRAQEIDWLRWMALNTPKHGVLEKLARDLDFDIRMRVACNPMAPAHVLAKLADDSSVFARRGVAPNRRTPASSLTKLSHDSDTVVQAQVFRNRTGLNFFLFHTKYEADTATLAAPFPSSRLSPSCLSNKAHRVTEEFMEQIKNSGNKSALIQFKSVGKVKQTWISQ